MSTFVRLAHVKGKSWGPMVKACVDTLGGATAGHSLGLVYLTPELAKDLPSVLTFLRETTKIEHWVGGVGLGVLAGGTEYRGQPALAAMTLAIEPALFRIFTSNGKDLTGLRQAAGPWLSAGNRPSFGLLHADSRHPRLPALVNGLATAIDGFVMGGLMAHIAVAKGQILPLQVAHKPVSAAASGLLVSAKVPMTVGLAQGCRSLGPYHDITECMDNVLVRLDGRPAASVLRDLLGELPPVPGDVQVGLPVAGSDTGERVVRVISAIDPVRGWITIGAEPTAGERIMFLRRDPDFAREDLGRMLADLKQRAQGQAPKAAIFVSCVARGGAMFGQNGAELALVREQLGDLPLIGFLAGGEIWRHRIHAQTGALALFL